jgi:hypothetical protein
MRVMDPLRLICESQGFFTRAMARDCGYSDKSVTTMVRAKVWHRFRRGYYSFTDIWNTLDAPARHLVRCRAVLHSLGSDVVLSHGSGLLAHGISTWGTPLDRVHVTRLDGDASRIEGDVVHHRGGVLPSEVVDADGMRALAPARCAVEYASMSSSESALVAFDSALHGEHCSREELFAQFARLGNWPGMRHVHVPIRLTSGKSASVGESRGFWMFWVAGLPAPERQFEVWNQDGELRATCDWGWPELDTYGEFDGQAKYGRLLKPGQDVGEVVFAEKQREDDVREITKGTMIRLVWADYSRPRVTIARLKHVLGRRRAG